MHGRKALVSFGQHFVENAVDTLSRDRWMMRKRPSVLLKNVDKEPSAVYTGPSLVDFPWVTWDRIGHSYLSKGYYYILSQICGVALYRLSSWCGLMSAVCMRVCQSLMDLSCSYLSSPSQARYGTVIPGYRFAVFIRPVQICQGCYEAQWHWRKMTVDPFQQGDREDDMLKYLRYR